MKHTMYLMRFAFDKIVNGTKRVEVRLFDEEHHKIKLNDVIEFVCQETSERVLCLVRGILVFERCDDLVALLPAKVFGYDNKEEVRLRLNRRFSFEEQLLNHVLGLIIMPLQVAEVERMEDKEHISEGRNAPLEEKRSFKKTFSEVKQMLKEEKNWHPVSQCIVHSAEEGLDEDEKAAQIECMRKRSLENEGRE